jgi:hypothetical protein
MVAAGCRSGAGDVEGTLAHAASRVARPAQAALRVPHQDNQKGNDDIG